MNSMLSTELFVTKFKKQSSSNKGIVWAIRKKTKKRWGGEPDFNTTCNIAWLLLFGFVSVCLRQDSLSATLQINPSVLAIKKF